MRLLLLGTLYLGDAAAFATPRHLSPARGGAIGCDCQGGGGGRDRYASVLNAHSDSSCYGTLIDWLERGGATLRGVEVAPMSPGSTERGLFATTAHAPGAEIARVPRAMCVTASSSGCRTAAGAALAASGARPVDGHQNLYLALWLLDPFSAADDGGPVSVAMMMRPYLKPCPTGLLSRTFPSSGQTPSSTSTSGCVDEVRGREGLLVPHPRPSSPLRRFPHRPRHSLARITACARGHGGWRAAPAEARRLGPLVRRRVPRAPAVRRAELARRPHLGARMRRLSGLRARRIVVAASLERGSGGVPRSGRGRWRRRGVGANPIRGHA